MNIGFAMCGSFCTFSQIFPIMEQLAKKHRITPIFSQSVYTMDSRFGTAQEHIRRAEAICGTKVLHTLQQVEPLGPGKALDALVIAPCTGNTLAKLAAGITDTAVTMAAKAHLRSDRPLIITLASNDALSANLKNIGTMLTKKQVYFVPMAQDDPINKPHSLVADFTLLLPTLEHAVKGKQYQKIFV